MRKINIDYIGLKDLDKLDFRNTLVFDFDIDKYENDGVYIDNYVIVAKEFAYKFIIQPQTRLTDIYKILRSGCSNINMKNMLNAIIEKSDTVNIVFINTKDFYPADIDAINLAINISDYGKTTLDKDLNIKIMFPELDMNLKK